MLSSVVNGSTIMGSAIRGVKQKINDFLVVKGVWINCGLGEDFGKYANFD